MNDFIREIKQYSTADIQLILKDQLDLYLPEEIELLKNELHSRPADALQQERKFKEQAEIELQKQEEQEEYNRQEQKRIAIEESERKSRELQHKARLNKLKQSGAEGYYEYKAISLQDIGGLWQNNSGRVDLTTMNSVLNELGLDGWRLVTAYSNELGKNAMWNTNSTVDENILIFERFVKI